MARTPGTRTLSRMTLENAGEVELVTKPEAHRKLGEPTAIAGKAPLGFLDAQSLHPCRRTQPSGTPHQPMNRRRAHFENSGKRGKIQPCLEVVANVELDWP